jgi:hypothetical protein
VSGRSYEKKKRKLSIVAENRISKKEDEKRKENGDDKFKTLSFASINSHERQRKSQVCIVGMHGFARSLLLLSLSISQGCWRHQWSY